MRKLRDIRLAQLFRERRQLSRRVHGRVVVRQQRLILLQCARFVAELHRKLRHQRMRTLFTRRDRHERRRTLQRLERRLVLLGSKGSAVGDLGDVAAGICRRDRANRGRIRLVQPFDRPKRGAQRGEPLVDGLVERGLELFH